MCPVSYEQVELGILFDLDADLIEAFNRSVAGEEVLGTRSKGNNLQALEAKNRAGNGNKLGNHLSHVVSGSYGIGRNPCLEVAHAEIVGQVQDTAEGVAAAVDEVAVALGCCRIHDGSVEVLGNEGLGCLGTEVSEEDHEGVDAGCLYLVNGGKSVLLVLYCRLCLKYVEALLVACGLDGAPAFFGQGNREAVAGNRDDAKLDYGNVFHNSYKPLS